MGSTSSCPKLRDPFQRCSEWKHEHVKRLLKEYQTQDLDFGLDAHGLSLILEGDKNFAEQIIPAFGSTNGLINALAFITGACVVARGQLREKLELLFDAFDFDQTQIISMDEMTILLLCALRGAVVMTELGKEPQDEAMEAITIQAYEKFDKRSNEGIAKHEFVTWACEFLGDQESLSVAELLAKCMLYELPTKGKQEEKAGHGPAAAAAVNKPSEVTRDSENVTRDRTGHDGNDKTTDTSTNQLKSSSSVEKDRADEDQDEADDADDTDRGGRSSEGVVLTQHCSTTKDASENIVVQSPNADVVTSDEVTAESNNDDDLRQNKA